MASRRPPTDSTRSPATRSTPVTPNAPAPGKPATATPTIASTDAPPISSGATAAESVASGKKAPPVRKPRAPRAKKADVVTGESVTIHISEDVRRGMIAEAAYLRAERRGFSSSPDQEREDWVAAEAEVDALLRESHGSSKQ